MILIKVNEVPPSKEALKDRVMRAWRMNMDRLYNQKELIAIYRGEILEMYKILSYKKDEQQPDRVAFELEEIDNELKGRKIISRTSNPATIVELNKLEFID